MQSRKKETLLKQKRLSHRALAIVLSALLIMGTGLAGFSAMAASTVKVVIANIPRGDDKQYSNANWGHPVLKLMNGATVQKETYFTVKILNDYDTGKVAYCLEPASALHTDDTLTQQSSTSTYFGKVPNNGTLSGNWQRKLVAAILYHGYQGTCNLNTWMTQNASGRAQLAKYWATQELVWEALVGERGPNFERVAVPSGFVSVDNFVQSGNPIRSDILSQMADIEQKLKAELLCPSFTTQYVSKAPTITLNYDNGSGKYTATVTDSNGVLSNWNLAAAGVTLSKSGNQLTLTSEKPITEAVELKASRNVPTANLVIWGDGTFTTAGTGKQDVASYGSATSESFESFAKLKTAGAPPTTQSTTQSTTKPTTQSTTKSTTQSTTKSTTQSTTKSTTQSTTQPTTQSTTQPTTQSTTQPTTQSTTQPTTQSTTQPTTQSTTQPTTQSTTKSTTQSTTQPTTQSTTQPTTQSTTQPTTQSTTVPVVVPEPTTTTATRTVPTSSTSTTARKSTTTSATTTTTTKPTSATKPSTTRKTEPVNTGDESKPLVWALVAALAAAAMGILFFLRQERERES